ncbi:MAG: UDP-N-acetylglucosamine 2-epimerase [Candidatus Magasanikbacteria bacterium GW2011_GWC2_40_17]|uniref:UDP-N-acetylglucosamine 2-epimerase n=1 Tax=Candidatus Magasanikbacteria bacterium GW2011_GWA2_42_32 TaxID=1619039 RepID=A0A0G1D5P3_9BACT|nr:MAG: UDP-N-acetylglucosamine 2-epimerase [Candidatus Magasanikbacteria bacterium GW2011_GWC2_40_17]KKS57378.1 MAG: UDP-N-acetylglucosamine 2-epimerase [Candidatus Magasanikbacteria bacterium GW2011_GWA2_42_32]
MSFTKIAVIGGARPNFMKIAPLCRAFDKQGMKYFIVNTGQHFDKNMAQNFFKEFKIQPNYNLRPPKNSVVKQFSGIMTGLEKILLKEKPNLVIVVGDVNSTLAAALVANKLKIKLAHIEAGLRSFNLAMAEEHNRVLTDHLSDYLFVTAEEGLTNLKKEGFTKNIYFVGNIMLDTLKFFLPKIKKTKEEFYFCTLHRPENVDHQRIFEDVLNALAIIAQDQKIYLPLHPRTKKMAEKFGLMNKMRRIFKLLPPLNYQDSIFYQKNARLVLTDSGGMQEEASFLGVPCLTLRQETERPTTVTKGTNIIGGVTKQSILKAYQVVKNRPLKKINIPKWDGRAAERIANVIKKINV